MEGFGPAKWLDAKRIFLAIQYSAQGLRFLIQNEAAFGQEIVLFLVSILGLYAIGCGHELLFVFAALVLICEALNTAVEKLCDEISTAQSAGIRVAKDCGSLAVSLCLLLYFGLVFRLLMG